MHNITLQVQSLSKKIGKKMIVDNISFDINEGEIFGLLGPNGAGKTTTVRMIVNLIKKTKGTVTINGHSLDQSFKLAINEVGAIVETTAFYKYMTGMKNLQLYARMATESIGPDRISEVVRLVGLEGDINEKVKSYSLGMRQRLGVAQALLHNPSLLILDEPTNGLDPQGIIEFRSYICSLAKKGISVLISSHLLSEMELMCDRFAIIEKGKIIHVSAMNTVTTTLEDRFLELTQENRKELTS